jgi:hypothetical protein
VSPWCAWTNQEKHSLEKKMSNKNIVPELLAESPNRRSLLRTIGMAGAAMGAAVAVGGKLKADPAMPSVVDVLQFALNLEYLEAEFYTVATMGMNIEQVGIGIDGTGTPGATTGGSMVSFANDLVFTSAIANQLGQDERDHVTLIRGALVAAGIMPVAKPAINLAALAPMGAGFGSEAQFLTLARIFEDIGVSAYAGATTLSTVTESPYISTAARILAAEALHSGNIRLQCARLGIPSIKLDGVDIVPPPAPGGTFFPTDPTTGLTAIRTPGQVLFLAYGLQPNATSGGFFPNGFNGALTTSTMSA